MFYSFQVHIPNINLENSELTCSNRASGVTVGPLVVPVSAVPTGLVLSDVVSIGSTSGWIISSYVYLSVILGYTFCLAIIDRTNIMYRTMLFSSGDDFSFYFWQVLRATNYVGSSYFKYFGQPRQLESDL